MSRNCLSNKAHKGSEMPKEEKIPDVSEFEFEARSSKHGAWYNVEKFLARRFPSTGETDEWVNVKKAVRERSVPLEHSECHTLKVGDHVFCILERRDKAIYYDSHITDIQRKMHGIRGRRCLFTIRYNPDHCEEIVSSAKTLDAACVFSS